MTKHYISITVALLLNAMYFYEWLGPKGGEGSYAGLGNALAMLAITVICTIVSLIYLSYMVIKKIKLKDSSILYTSLMIYGFPVVLTIVMVLYNTTKNGY